MKHIVTSLVIGLLSFNAFAADKNFTLTSSDIKEGHFMAKTFEYSGWGCDGDNISPHLKWENAPKGTQSFAITMYDPDAPTESGFWHWIAVDIPVSTTELKRGTNLKKLGALETKIDYGTAGFGGACPPNNDGMHRYQFTIWALPAKSLNLNENTPSAVVGFTLNSMALGKARLTATYAR